jgi:hypothetical protein
MPLLRSGFELDWFSIAMVVLGAAHVQVGVLCVCVCVEASGRVCWHACSI